MTRARIAMLCAAVLAVAGAGYALAGGSGSGGATGTAPAAQPYAPNGGSSSGLPQREVAVQPAAR